MKKTNIRLKNNFIIEDKKTFFLSSIKEIEKWKNIEEEDLESYKEEDVTDKINNLMKKYSIFSNVNFFDGDEKRKINISQKGGWGSKKSSKKDGFLNILSGGGWGAIPSQR